MSQPTIGIDPLLASLQRASAHWESADHILNDLLALGLIGIEDELDLPTRSAILCATANMDGSAALWLFCRWLSVGLLAAVEADIPEDVIGLPLWNAPTQWPNTGVESADRLILSGVQPDRAMVLPTTGDDKVELRLAASGAGALAIPTLGFDLCATVTLTRQQTETFRPVGWLPKEKALQIWQRAELYSSALRCGLVQASYDNALEWARTRKQGGKFICEHGIVQRMLDTMQDTRDELQTLTLHLSAVPTTTQMPRPLLRQANRLAAATVEACSIGMQIFGGNGYMEEYPQTERLRDAQQAEMLLGHPLRRYTGEQE